MRVWREKNRERHNELARESYERNKHKHVDRGRALHLWRSYGLSEADYDLMFAAQLGVCGICEKEFERRLHVDHDHETGRVRGLLCPPCNQALGWYEKHAAKAADYLAD